MHWDSPLAGRHPVLAKADHPVWEEIKQAFKPTEFQRPYDMDAEFLRLLYQIRKDADVPFRLVSDARPPDQDIGADKSAHKKRPCRAVDLKPRNSYERARIVMAAVRRGIVRIGVYPTGSLHLDAETHPDNPSPRLWTSY